MSQFHQNPVPATARRLIAMQGADGLWGAFRLRPGESRDWIGAVAGLALAEAAASGRLPANLTVTARNCAERAAMALRHSERPGGGWGYNGAVPPDSDSTAAVLRLFAALRQDVPAASVGFLAAQGDPVGGWATYGPMRRWDNWSLPCPEVDAAAALALASVGALVREALVTLWQTRLAPRQGADGHWRAYWWPGPGVATLAALELWVAAGRPVPPPTLPAGATPDMAAIDGVTLAQARGLLDPQAGAQAMHQAVARMAAPGRWPADAVLLAPPRHPASTRGESSLEGRGVATTAAALRALLALPALPMTRPSRPRPTAQVTAEALETLARGLGLSRLAAQQARLAGAALLGPLLGVSLPWPNPAVSCLARGWPIEFSATLDPTHRPALRLAVDLGDPRLSPVGRARIARASLAQAARAMHLDPRPLDAGLAPLLACARHADTAERFLIWGGLDLTDEPGGPAPILKAYANLALAGPDSDARLSLAAHIIIAAGGADVTDVLRRLGAAMQAGSPQQMGLALTARGLAGAKVYWELPGHDEAAAGRLAAALKLDLPKAFTPELPGLVSLAAARRGLAGLAVHIDPWAGLTGELTLAIQAPSGITWRQPHESRSIAAWAGGMGLSPDTALSLMKALRAHGAAPRSLHTVTLRASGRLRAALYFHADGWLSASLPQRGASIGSDTVPRSPHRSDAALVSGELS